MKKIIMAFPCLLLMHCCGALAECSNQDDKFYYQCLDSKIEYQRELMQKSLDLAIKRISGIYGADRVVASNMLNESQKKWEAYASTQCKLVGEVEAGAFFWRNVRAARCTIEIIEARIKEIDSLTPN